MTNSEKEYSSYFDEGVLIEKGKFIKILIIDVLWEM